MRQNEISNGKIRGKLRGRREKTPPGWERKRRKTGRSKGRWREKAWSRDQTWDHTAFEDCKDHPGGVRWSGGNNGYSIERNNEYVGFFLGFQALCCAPGQETHCAVPRVTCSADVHHGSCWFAWSMLQVGSYWVILAVKHFCSAQSCQRWAQ